jgi:hypothetical protein
MKGLKDVPIGTKIRYSDGVIGEVRDAHSPRTTLDGKSVWLLKMMDGRDYGDWARGYLWKEFEILEGTEYPESECSMQVFKVIVLGLDNAGVISGILIPEQMVVALDSKSAGHRVVVDNAVQLRDVRFDVRVTGLGY